jgi:beta-aspartyl-peptidase (threonine type)
VIVAVQPALIVHGGAWAIPDDQVDAHINGCRRAAEVGWALLCKGASAVDVVEAAVRVMEDDPTFDAGCGSHLNAAGEVELDALIMEGATLKAGSVAAVQRVRNPVSLARLVMEKSEHVLLVAKGAERFARDHGIPICQPEELLTGRELERWKHVRGMTDWHTSRAFETAYTDTVGAVARDAAGNVAAATSTGGTPNKLPGRVGDSPLIGCGAYADNLTGGVSATGWGEALMKVVMSKTTCDFIARGLGAQHAAESAVKLLAERVQGLGGVIVVDALGRIGSAHNTPRMAHAYVTSEGNIVARVN